jgi:dipeptidyl aminopeptidase/acylaminoacyl peptidase
MERLSVRICFPLLCSLLLMLAACGNVPALNSNAASTSTGQPPSSTDGQGNAAANSGASGNANTATHTIPPTTTSCPPSGTARAMVMATMAPGSHNSLVYVVNEFTAGTNPPPKAGTLKRLDVTDGQKTVIVGIPHVSIEHAQVSANGQWILFTTYASTQTRLQVVRMDGQGLQTLYCTTGVGINNPQWSSDQQHVIFSTFGAGVETVSLLTTTTGALQTELSVPDSGGGQGVVVRTWLDNSRFYLSNIQIDQPPNLIYILNINNGPQQNVENLPALVNKTYGDFDSSYNGQQLYVDYGYCGQGGCAPPSSITVEPAGGGAQTTIFNNAQYDVVMVRAVTAGTLLMVIRNDQAFGSTDSSHNGLWKMNPNGSGLLRLTSDAPHTGSSLNSATQFPWSNLSRDNRLYALQTTSDSHVFTLEYGSLSGGAPTVFASLGDGTEMEIAGWTFM